MGAVWSGRPACAARWPALQEAAHWQREVSPGLKGGYHWLGFTCSGQLCGRGRSSVAACHGTVGAAQHLVACDACGGAVPSLGLQGRFCLPQRPVTHIHAASLAYAHSIPFQLGEYNDVANIHSHNTPSALLVPRRRSRCQPAAAPASCPLLPARRRRPPAAAMPLTAAPSGPWAGEGYPPPGPPAVGEIQNHIALTMRGV